MRHQLTVEERLAHAERIGVGAKVFHLSQPSYIQQVGDSEPRYVAASPSAPVAVVLEAKIERPVKVKKADGKGHEYVRNEDGSLKTAVVDHPVYPHLKAKPTAPPKDVRPGSNVAKVPRADAATKKLPEAPVEGAKQDKKS